MLAFTLVLAGLVVYNTIPSEAPPSIFEPLFYFSVTWLGVVALFILVLLVIEFIAAFVGAIMRMLLPY